MGKQWDGKGGRGGARKGTRKREEAMETYEFSFGFELGCLHVAPVHVRIEQLPAVIAAHRHSNTSYEIHYTRRGRGSVTIDGKTRGVGPDTLYVTGPGVEHAQRSDPHTPIIEYCLYLNCRMPLPAGGGPLFALCRNPFLDGRGRRAGLPAAGAADRGGPPPPERSAGDGGGAAAADHRAADAHVPPGRRRPAPSPRRR